MVGAVAAGGGVYGCLVEPTWLRVIELEAALLDPDYVRFPVLMRLASEAGFEARERFVERFQYTQRFLRPA